LLFGFIPFINMNLFPCRKGTFFTIDSNYDFNRSIPIFPNFTFSYEEENRK